MRGFPTASKSLERQINRASMVWLLGAQMMVMAPFLADLPTWLLPLLLLTSFWRFRVLKGHWQQPGWPTKGLAVTLGIGGLVLSGIEPLSLDAATSLLLLGFALKNLELSHRRDGVLVVFIGYLLVATRFLYTQTIPAALYGVVCLTVLTATLISLHQIRSHSLLDNLRLSGFMLLQCIPLMILAYLFLPRLPPIWSVPLPGGNAVTGVSDEISPGDIANLAQSDKLAFRVTFQGEAPQRAELYWRGLVLNHFDGTTWRQMPPGREDLDLERIESRQSPLFRPTFKPLGREYSYSLIYEPTHQPWLFALTPPVLTKGQAHTAYDFRLVAEQPLTYPLGLTLKSYPNARLDPALPLWVRYLATQLPEGENPQARTYARRQRVLAGSDLKFANRMLRKFGEETFHYTLRPPVLGKRDTIDRFLFESRRGFCAHFASSYVFLMRAAGIPARIVAGYQGGEWNETGGYFAVRQYDAHAWAEVWLANRGWQRVDPTAYVAPSRIEQDLAAAVAQEGSFLSESVLSPIKFTWMTGIRWHLDAIQYQWQRWVLGYSNDDQEGLLTSLLGEVTGARIAVVVGGSFGFILLFWIFVLGLARRRETVSEEYRYFQHIIEQLNLRGFNFDSSHTPTDILTSVQAKQPVWTAELEQFVDGLNRRLYLTNGEPSDIKSAFVKLRRKLKKGAKND